MQRSEPGGRERVLDPPNHRREHRVGEVRKDHTDRERPVRLEAAGDRVRRVAHLTRRLGHARRGLGADEVARALVERPRRRRGMDPDPFRDVAQGHRAAARRSMHGARHRRSIVPRRKARKQTPPGAHGTPQIPVRSMLPRCREDGREAAAEPPSRAPGATSVTARLRPGGRARGGWRSVLGGLGRRFPGRRRPGERARQQRRPQGERRDDDTGGHAGEARAELTVE